jgi:hypothetical protein
MGLSKFIKPEAYMCWNKMEWQCFSPEIIVKGCKKCCMSNAMNGTDEDMSWNDNKEDENFVCSHCNIII